jgi:DNA-binding IclR family transcriptional regulator
MTDKATKAPAIARAAAILRLLGKSETQLGVNAIARALHLAPSTCLYALRALVDEGLVAFDPDRKTYRLDAAVLSLARAWLRQSRFADLARPALAQLAHEQDVTLMGVQIYGMRNIIVVATAQGSGNFQLSAELGSRFPALISATGRCIAAFGGHDEAQIADKFSTLRWDNPPEFALWLEQVEQTKRAGFAVDDGNYIDGVSVLAAPVRHDGRELSHALVAIGINSTVKRKGVDVIGKALVEQANIISEQLRDG